MRIIAGEHRGRRLIAPASDATRPITDRAKQSLFDILAPNLPGAGVYDLFAGTGSMGLEALSRGARHATFFEKERTAVTRLRQNIDALRVQDRSTVVPGDLFAWFASRSAPADPIDVAFLDPPYLMTRESPDRLKSLAVMICEKHLAATGVIMVRHDLDRSLALSPLVAFNSRCHGQMMIELWRRPTPGELGGN